MPHKLTVPPHLRRARTLPCKSGKWVRYGLTVHQHSIIYNNTTEPLLQVNCNSFMIHHVYKLYRKQTNKYESAIDQELAYAAHSSGGSTFLHEMTSWPPSWMCDIKSKIRLHQSMRIYLKNNPAKFHPDPIWNDGAFVFFLKRLPNTEKKNKNKMSSDVRSVPDLKIYYLCSKFRQISCKCK